MKKYLEFTKKPGKIMEISWNFVSRIKWEPCVFFQVNEYMIFTVRASAWVDKIYYLICSKGNIVVGNTLEMASTQKTFSVALSREMVPSARIVAYYILNGEVVSDALNFHVNGTSLNPVEVRLITQSVFWKCIGFDTDRKLEATLSITVNGIQRCIHTEREHMVFKHQEWVLWQQAMVFTLNV